MDFFKKKAARQRQRLNKMYRDNNLAKGDFVEKIRNGLFDSERLEIRKRFDKIDNQD